MTRYPAIPLMIHQVEASGVSQMYISIFQGLEEVPDMKVLKLQNKAMS